MRQAASPSPSPSLPPASPPSPPSPPALAGHLAFLVSGALAFLGLMSFLRLLLLLYNRDLIGDTPAHVWLEAFGNGLRFDLKLLAFFLLPLLFPLLSLRLMAARRWMRGYVVLLAAIALLLGVIELDFYREFHQRLNGLVFQYLAEDPKTVLSMIWHGFPVVPLLLGWVFLTWIFLRCFCFLDSRVQRYAASGWLGRFETTGASRRQRGIAFALCLLLLVLAARGTLRQGPPLRWGDAFTTESVFANQLGLNGLLTLADAARARFSAHRDNAWKSAMPPAEALRRTRALLLTAEDVLVDAETAAVRRDFSPSPERRLPVKNVVLILMESFAGRYVGALGAAEGVTPHFDALAEEGLRFTRFFGNGTHTHQGMFATLACFPNLPGFEYLMQTPEGGHAFSGLPQLLAARGYRDVYVYNGDFAWDNQSGFFGKQGMTTFIGRHDYVDPVFSDPTWGVSDEDMFRRAHAELEKLAAAGEPFYALLQSLSNHAPYALPEKLPVAPVSGHGALDMRLTAMRYSDWALGEFFAQAKKSPWYRETLFVVLGDHGFGGRAQLTEMDLYRFHVPLLLIAPGIREKFGARRETVASQVDVVPTIMGLLGGATRHQCWGRDLLGLPPEDEGFAVIKPSGSDQTVAFLAGGDLLVQAKNDKPRLYAWRLGARAKAAPFADKARAARLQANLDAYLQTATRSLLEDTAGNRGRATTGSRPDKDRAGAGACACPRPQQPSARPQ
jgi:phosphoglycerol transferase MdoB-like AlkP superfamily enzyme